MNRLDCAATLLRAGGRDELICKCRKVSETLLVNGETVIVRDHHPTLKKVKLPPGWILGDYVEYLNGFVYFFPGKKDKKEGPITSEWFIKRYKQQQALCIPTKDLFMANQGTPPQFSRCNSGAPPSWKPCRGPDTFMCGERFENKDAGKGIPSKVVEVAFRCKVKLPDSLEVFGYDCKNNTWNRI